MTLLQTEQLYESFNEFLIIFIHAIFYSRKLYPRVTFTRVRHYDTGSYQNNHPGVQEWVENVATVVTQTIRNHGVKGISFVIVKGTEPIERFVLDLSHIPRMHQDIEPVPADVIEAQYKAAIASILLNIPDEIAEETPKNSVGERSTMENQTMTIVYHGDISDELRGPDSVWIQSQSSFENKNDNWQKNLTPLRFLEAGAFSFSLYHQVG